MRGATLLCAALWTTTAFAFAQPREGSAPSVPELMPLPELGQVLDVTPAEYVHPVRGHVGYGEAAARFGVGRGDHVHQGQDVFAPSGTLLRAVTDSVVLETGSGDGRGNYVAIYDAAARRTYVYFHMQSPSPVKKGEHLHMGDSVGRVGCTGSCFGTHLHFEVRRGRGADGQAINPRSLLERWGRATS
jgi:murein DD-endopeptidase MepM/ murein hydrolase activator NlpD